VLSQLTSIELMPKLFPRDYKGVGLKKAAAIIQYRKEHGEFKSLKDLENVKGIGEKTVLANQKNILFADTEDGKQSDINKKKR